MVNLAGGAPGEPPTNDALEQLTLLLELNNEVGPVAPGNQDLREQWLSESLRSQPLEDDEEEEVVAALNRFALAGESEAQRIGPIGVINRAAAALKIEPLLRLLVEHRKRFGPESVRLVLIGLERALEVFNSPPEELEKRHASHVSLVLRLIDPRPAVEELAADENERVAEPARRLGPRIERAREYLGTGT